jgi:hypothetical protein
MKVFDTQEGDGLRGLVTGTIYGLALAEGSEL